MYWQEAIKAIKPLDGEYKKIAQSRLDQLTKPQGSLGRLEDLAMQLVSIYKSLDFSVAPITSYIFVGDHNITEEGVSAFPSEVTTQMVYNFLQGGAAINVLSSNNNVGLKVVDVGMKSTIDNPRLIQRKVRAGAGNFLREKALTEEEVIKAIQIGFDLGVKEIEEGTRMLSIGEMGIGNTTSSAALTAHLLGLSVDETVGRGTGLNDNQLQHKKEIIKKAFQFHQLSSKDPIETLSAFGGLEIAAMTGMILAASFKQVPVILDGIIAGAAALVASYINSEAVSYMIASHRSEEPAHRFILEALNLSPLLQLSMRLGEGTGAVLSVPLIRSTQHLFQEMATFAEANVSQKRG